MTEPSGAPPPFVHLHCHSEFSLLDGANRLTDLITRAGELGMPALALTDHGNLYGAWHFQRMARAAGIKPIIGCELYVAYGDRRQRRPNPDAPGGRRYAHLVVLAENPAGYRNLCKLSSIGHLEGFYHKPRVDREVLAAHSEGLIVLSACLVGEVASYLMNDRWDEAKATAEWYARTFPGRYWLEIQDHGLDEQKNVNSGVIQLADELGLPLTVTNDAHYLNRGDADAHDTLLCIGTGKMKTDEDRLRFHGEEIYFKSAREMAELFPDRPDALASTVEIAERCNVEFDTSYHLPEFPLPADFEDPMEMLRHEAGQGARRRYGDPLPPEVRERLEFELGVIERTGYAGYLLIVWDFIEAARRLRVPVGPGRGSAAGSIICYSLGITDIEPLHFGLLFERFLNPERVSMPDIDIDFCYERRGEVLEYVRQKYGRDSVGHIVTFGTMQARAVIRDVGRVLGFTPQATDKLAKLVPQNPARKVTVAGARQDVKDLREQDGDDDEVKRLLDYAQQLEGLSRHESVHAAGVVIAPGPLSDYVPVCADKRNPEVVVTQFDMVALEQAGMLKMDFLGLRTLTVIEDAVAMVKERTGETVDWDRIGLEDARVFEHLAKGETRGVFQFESALAADKLRAMRCDRFDDLVAVNALIRPGPLDSGMTDVYIRRKRGEQPVDYPDPRLKGILEPTYGIITYQEQVMQAANKVAGFSLAEADVLRKAVGKKDAELTDRVLKDFVEGAVKNGVERAAANELAELIRTFGRYGFNKAHSVAYAMLSYRTAWLKVHYPAEFMAALMSSEIGQTDRVVSSMALAQKMDLRVLPPSVAESGYRFTVVDDPERPGKSAIRFGLGAIKGAGESAVRSIVEARAESPFTGFLDFLERIDLRLNNAGVLQALIGAGALDSFGDRAAMVKGLETMLREAQSRQHEVAVGQVSLFGGGSSEPRPSPTLPEQAPWSERERLREEKARLGFYISGHPLRRHREIVHSFARTAATSRFSRLRDRNVEVACVITETEVRTSRRDGREYARLTIEDFEGTATALVFSKAWERYRDSVGDDRPVLIAGTVSGNSRDDDDPPLFVNRVVPLAEAVRPEDLMVLIPVTVGDGVATEKSFREARRLAESAPGASRLGFEWLPAGDDEAAAQRAPGSLGRGPWVGSGGGRPSLGNGHQEPWRLTSRTLRVEASSETIGRLRTIFGDGVRVERIAAAGRR